MTNDMSNFYCTTCKKVMSSYREVGYEGLDPESGIVEECWMPGMEWLVLCHRCADERNLSEAKTQAKKTQT